MNESSICFNIKSPGIYFGTVSINDVNNPIDNVTQGMFIMSAVLYLICLFFWFWQAIRYFKDQNTVRKIEIKHFKPLLLGIIFIFCFLRIIYMGMVLNVNDNKNGAMVALFEVPSVLFFCMQTGIFYIWRLIVNSVRKLNILTENVNIPLLFWIGNSTLI